MKGRVMGKRKSPKNDEDFAYWRLRTDCFKLIALMSLFRNQKYDGSPDDNTEVGYGISLILQDIHDDVLAVAEEIEDHQIKVAKRETA